MTRIVGLDLSLVATGIALPDGTTRTLRARIVDPREARLNQLQSDLCRILEPHEPELAIIEGYSFGSPSQLVLSRIAEWVGNALVILRRFRCPVVEVPPSKLKKWATGHGVADKPAMVAAARAAGGDPANDDEADAYLLRALGVLVVDDVDLFNDPAAVHSRRFIADDLAWPHEILEVPRVS